MIPRLLLVLLVVLLWSGCAGPQDQFRHTDFLGDYSGFKPLPKLRGAYGYAKPGLSLAAYDQVLVEPVEVRLDSKATAEVGPEDLERLSGQFHAMLTSELGQQFKVVDKPGRGVMRLRTALTGVTPKLDVGFSSGASGKSYRPELSKPGEAAQMYLRVSGAAMEMEALDAATGERLAAAVDRKGKDVAADGGQWEAVEQAFKYWSANVGKILGDLRKQ